MTEKSSINNQFFLIFNGPSCSGKTTVANIFEEKYKGLFLARRDKIKWLISDYETGKYKEFLEEVLVDIVDLALKHGFSVIKEGLKQDPKSFNNLAKKHNINITTVNISAPKDILRSRFQDRVNNIKFKASNKSPEQFEKFITEYENNKFETPLEFDSSLKSPEEIANDIISYLKN